MKKIVYFFACLIISISSKAQDIVTIVEPKPAAKEIDASKPANLYTQVNVLPEYQSVKAGSDLYGGQFNIQYAANAQQQSKKEFKNTIKYNVTNPFIFGKDVIILGYERVVKKHQSIMVNFGRTALPKLATIKTDSMNIIKSNKNTGLNFSAEYRFYLGKENKYNAPRGVYLAPYYSYNSFRKENTWSLTKFDYNGEVNTDLSLKVQTVGVELGYQFVFWDRLAVDFVMLGPGYANYKLKAGINTTLSPANQLELLEKINDYLSDKLPGYNFVIPETEFTATGSCTTNSFNFRYLIQVGFRF